MLQIECPVAGADPDIGYLHSGFEKIGEHLNYNQYVTVTDRMNYLSPLANNVAWHHAVETLFEIDVPKRCHYIRIILAELSRIGDHLAVGRWRWIPEHSPPFCMPSTSRETCTVCSETICGARFTTSYTRVGGLMYDATPEFIQQVRDFVIPGSIPTSPDLDCNRIFVERTSDRVLPRGGSQSQCHGADRPSQRESP